MKNSSKILYKLINIQNIHPFEDIIISCFSVLQIQFCCWRSENNWGGYKSDGNGTKKQREMKKSLFIVFTIIIVCVNTIICQRHDVFLSDSCVLRKGFCEIFAEKLEDFFESFQALEEPWNHEHSVFLNNV